MVKKPGVAVMSKDNMMEIDGYKAVIKFDPEIEMFRGEFIGFTGCADFYANNIQALKNEAEKSLQIYLDACNYRGINPTKQFTGRFNVRISPLLQERLTLTAESKGISLNRLVEEVLNLNV
ncbi:type II toxin-antitoxin system HicB family antitoxin [Methylophaga sp.]|jgi:predicted HicB family RNase H-like nuclease|uniref:type II toxin-antitoxin system HicB family antitoxin n=1 Tax=Methylophaga sp. TaxID=2024840 RepID=UPI0027222FD0|nr:type II toxin-antitoxin system HicB family antitoxin [Methylophaga sp.]MDO8827736.1 type II toxin-antitoxin system HicB family antitoxin [Methylophaga sp.]